MCQPAGVSPVRSQTHTHTHTPPPGLMERAGAEHRSEGAAVEVEQPGKTLRDGPLHVHMLASFQMKSFYVKRLRGRIFFTFAVAVRLEDATELSVQRSAHFLLWHHSLPIPVSGFSKRWCSNKSLTATLSGQNKSTTPTR